MALSHTRISLVIGLLILFIISVIASCATQQPEVTQQQDQPAQQQTEPDRNGLHVLFLGDDGFHQPAERLEVVNPHFAERGIYLHYTENQEVLNLETLKRYDVFLLYGNRTGLPREQEKALYDYVEQGGGFVGLHSASAMFQDSDAFINLLGGAFKWHGDGTFSTTHVKPDHPAIEGVPEFESWDETYVHMQVNPDITVLSVREDDDYEEPWTWVRKHGDGRIFYSAWGHDHRTWSNDGFKQLLEQGLRWSAGDWALEEDFTPPQLTFGEGELPYYPPGEDWGVVGDPITEVQNPLSPEESKEHVVSDPAFRIELFASEDQVVNPIDMTWDEEGRLWVLETVDYPNEFTEDREGNDRIKILEDTNGDGRADEVTIFADGLNIPTSLVLANGGVIVAQAPDIFFFEDTTGDDRADHKEVLFTGWETFDTHAGPNNLHYGFNNEIWGTVGYAGFIGEVGGKDYDFAQSMYHFTPEGDKLSHVANTTNNTWGLGFSEEGIVFASTANGNPAVHNAVPLQYYGKVNGWSGPQLPTIANTDYIYPLLEEVRQVDHHGSYTSASGFHIYTARDFPKEYWNSKAFVSDPTGHLIGQFHLERSGSSFSATNERNLLASRDEWFSPIQSKVGPDGALWVLDWYNLVIQHNPTPDGFEPGEGNAYVHELRDRDHARVYRVVYNDADNPDENFNLADATADELVDALSHDNKFWRLTAQRLLVERGEQDVFPQLYDLVRKNKFDELGLNPGALHAIWTLQGLDAFDGSNDEAMEVLGEALYHPVSSVRRAAIMNMPRTEGGLRKIMTAEYIPNPLANVGTQHFFRPLAADHHVRMAAIQAIADMPAADYAGEAVAELLSFADHMEDRWLRDATTAAAAKNDISFLRHSLNAIHLGDDADSTYIENVSNTIMRVSRHYAMEQPDDAGQIAGLFETLEGADESVGKAFVDGLAGGWDTDMPEFGDSELSSLQGLRSSLPESYDEALDELADQWDNPDIFGTR